ncbi:MAG: OmpW family outer membrane protein [Paracoccaceae bacterium]
MKIIAIASTIAVAAISTAHAEERGSWYIQAGPAGISFNESTSLSVAGTGVPGAGSKVSSEGTLAVGLGYFITPNISVIGLGGIPPTSAITGSGSVTGLNPGKIQYAPFILAANYHFNQTGKFQPFVGVGATYTMILDEKSGDIENLKAKNAFGPVLRIGFDYMIDDHQGVFFSAQKLFVDSTVTGTVAPYVPGLGGAPVSAKIDLDPVIIHAGYTYRF